ncbi:hypothetical protein COP1_012036 [Malus domestica]
MLKMSTREQCQWELQASRVLTLSEHFEKMVCGIWKADVACEDCRQALSKEIWLSKFRKRCLFGFRTSNPIGDLALEIQIASALKKWYVVSGKLMLRVKIADKLYPKKSGPRSSESGASFGFRTSNPIRDLALEIQRTVPLRFLRKQSCWESGS